MTLRRIGAIVAGAGAVACFLAARQYPVADVPLAGSFLLEESSWAGGGRLWVPIVCSALALLLSIFRRGQRFTLLLAALAMGLLADVYWSGEQWVSEKMEMIAELGAGHLTQQIQWKEGAVFFAVGSVFLLAQLLLVLYAHERRNGLPESKP